MAKIVGHVDIRGDLTVRGKTPFAKKDAGWNTFDQGITAEAFYLENGAHISANNYWTPGSMLLAHDATGMIAISDGTDATPDTGFEYRNVAGVDRLTVYAGGASNLVVTETEVRVANGNAAAPTLVFEGSTTTGLYRDDGVGMGVAVSGVQTASFGKNETGFNKAVRAGGFYLHSDGGELLPYTFNDADFYISNRADGAPVVNLQPAPNWFSQQTIENTNAESDILNFTVPGGSIGPRGYLNVKTRGHMFNFGGTRTATFRVYFGGTMIFEGSSSSLPASSSFKKPIFIEMDLMNQDRVDKQRLVGRALMHNASTATVGMGAFSASTTINGVFGSLPDEDPNADSSVDQDFRFTIHPSAASTAFSFYLMSHAEIVDHR
jgi:hypothetical protein